MHHVMGLAAEAPSAGLSLIQLESIHQLTPLQQLRTVHICLFRAIDFLNESWIAVWRKSFLNVLYECLFVPE